MLSFFSCLFLLRPTLASPMGCTTSASRVASLQQAPEVRYASPRLRVETGQHQLRHHRGRRREQAAHDTFTFVRRITSLDHARSSPPSSSSLPGGGDVPLNVEGMPASGTHSATTTTATPSSSGAPHGAPTTLSLGGSHRSGLSHSSSMDTQGAVRTNASSTKQTPVTLNQHTPIHEVFRTVMSLPRQPPDEYEKVARSLVHSGEYVPTLCFYTAPAPLRPHTNPSALCQTFACMRLAHQGHKTVPWCPQAAPTPWTSPGPRWLHNACHACTGAPAQRRRPQ